MANRNLIDYLPQFMQEYLEMQKIMSTEQTEINSAWTAADNGFKDQFISDATENGVSRWESILSISPKTTDTLAERKDRILIRLNQELPYTMTRLKEYLTNLCGEEGTGFTVTLTPSTYYIHIKIARSNQNNFDAVESMVTKMIPANMTKLIEVMYNPYSMLTEYTHSELTNLTHNQLRTADLDAFFEFGDLELR